MKKSKEKVVAMLQSNLGLRMIKADGCNNLYKEQQFSIGVNVSDIYTNEELLEGIDESYAEDITDEFVKPYIVTKGSYIKENDSVIEKGEDVNTLPTTKAVCPECGHTEASWWLQQTRSADEAETRFFKCLKCGHTWREYD